MTPAGQARTGVDASPSAPLFDTFMVNHLTQGHQGRTALHRSAAGTYARLVAELDDRDLPTVLGGNQRVLGVLLVLHGLVHLLGAVLAARLFEPGNFVYDDVWPAAGSWPGRLAAVGWVVVAAGLVVAGVRLANRYDVKRWSLLWPLVGSVILCVASAPAALFGAVVSGGLLVALVWLWVNESSPASSPDH